MAGGQNHSGINMTIQRGRQIIGTMALPGGQLAPANRSGTIRISNQAGRDFINGSDSVNIPIGANASMMYTVTVPDDPGQTWVARYSRCACCENNGFLGEGYYTASGSYRQDDASGMAGGQNHNDIDLTLLPAKTISGTVSLPAGHTANEELEISVRVTEDRLSPSPWLGPFVFGGYGDSDNGSIPMGGSNVMYGLVIPDDPAFHGTVRFECFNFSAGQNRCDDWVNTYASSGFYRSGGTTYIRDQATHLAGGQNHANINMSLVEGRTISG